MFCLHDTVEVTALPPPQAMLKAPAMILGVKGASNQHRTGGRGECANMRVFDVFASVPRLLARSVVLAP